MLEADKDAKDQRMTNLETAMRHGLEDRLYGCDRDQGHPDVRAKGGVEEPHRTYQCD